jgi:Flp pilus assembly pilin Flp
VVKKEDLKLKNINEKGASSIEYALLVTFIATVIVMAVSHMGQALQFLYEFATKLLPGG